MTDKRGLYRGFNPDENGKATITLNGENIRGEWLYWNVKGERVDKDMDHVFIYAFTDKPIPISCYEIIPETIGQWVTTDKNGKDLFLGDIVKCKHTILRRFDTKEGATEFRKARRSYGHRVIENTAWGCPMWDIEYWRNYEIVYDSLAMRIKLKNGSDYHYLCSSYIDNHEIELIGNKWEVEK